MPEEEKLLFGDYLVQALFWFIIGLSIATWDFWYLFLELLVLKLYGIIIVFRIVSKFIDKYS